ncbi:acetylglutamate kinase [Halobacteriales archaeon QS_1_68_20]|nr:MAG: acetylglutamate kinase [Halobacteriales archaeon QS_1_68_20]
MTTVLKLGGSVITEKDSPETLDDDALSAVADDVAGADVSDLVVVHGGGSFGHHNAAAHGVTTENGSHETTAVADIHGAMKTLNESVLAHLRDRGVPAVPVHPLSAARRDAEGALTLFTEQVAAMLDEGFVPVLHGDLVVHDGEGVTVVSGDELVVDLADTLDADRVGLCSTVPGVLDEDGAVVARIESYEDVADALGGSDATDVTGGMAAKVRELLALSAPANVFDADGVGPFLAGESPGTRID